MRNVFLLRSCIVSSYEVEDADFVVVCQTRDQKPPSKKGRQILRPGNISRSEVRPERFERRCARSAPSPEVLGGLMTLFLGRVSTVA
jgi:hypothetical protein